MRAVRVHVLNAFVHEGIGGNPAGVVLEADALSREAKQRIAAKAGYSETAFVSASRNADYKIEFFTPVSQIALCGHATVATFSHLAHLGEVTGHHSSMETLAGNRDIFLEEDRVFLEQTTPRYQAPGNLSQEEIMASLGLKRGSLMEGQSATVVNTGESFLIIPLQDAQTLVDLEPNFQAIERISEQLGLVGYYAFSTQTRSAGHDAGARMFAPRYGIDEEAATGMAAGPLACFLFDFLGVDKQTLLIEQGFCMKPASPSILTVSLNVMADRIQDLKVGGRAIEAETLDMILV